jgi:tetratricopeptide (TPR) repeat protein
MRRPSLDMTMLALPNRGAAAAPPGGGRLPRLAWALPALLLMFTVAGCTSTKERYERGQEQEASGDYAGAARYYVQVLEREPSWEDVRERLAVAGSSAVEAYLAEARTHAQAGRNAEAVDVLDGLDQLRRGAERVGVPLAVPDDYAAYRKEVSDRALLDLLGEAQEAERRGDWNAALRAYERAPQRYDMPPERQQELVETRARLYVRWGEQELARRRYRAAYGRAQQALALLGPDAGPLEEAALSLQEGALAEGTHFVAFFPVRLPPYLDRTVPRGFLEGFNDELQYAYWAAPPPFLVETDPVELRRELRRLRYDRLSVRQAAEIGRVLDADVAVISDLDAFERKELNLREERQGTHARTRPAGHELHRAAVHAGAERAREIRPRRSAHARGAGGRHRACHGVRTRRTGSL